MLNFALADSPDKEDDTGNEAQVVDKANDASNAIPGADLGLLDS